MFEPSSGVRAQLAEQERALVERVAGSRLYTHEPLDFRVALAAYPGIAGELGVAEDLGTITTPESRNLVRKVRLRDGTFAALKIVGNTREPGEGDVLLAWHSAGLPVPEPLAFGTYPVHVDGAAKAQSATYVMTSFVEGPMLSAQVATSLEDKSALTTELASYIRPFHDSRVSVDESRRWQTRIGLHTMWTVPLLRAHRLAEPDSWERILNDLSDRGDFVLHGDPAPVNILRSPAGLVLLDPPGSLRGMREADVGQICSQIGGVADVEALVDVAVQADPTLDRRAVAAFAGINFLTWAGYSLAEHPNPDVPAIGGNAEQRRAAGIANAREFLATSDRLLQPYRDRPPAAMTRRYVAVRHVPDVAGRRVAGGTGRATASAAPLMPWQE